MIAGWIAAVLSVLSIVGVLVRISYQTGQLVARFAEFRESADRIHDDQEKRLRLLETRLPRRA